MAEGDPTNNRSILTIIVAIAILLALLYYFGIFGPRERVTTTEERTRINTERPAEIRDQPGRTINR